MCLVKESRDPFHMRREKRFNFFTTATLFTERKNIGILRVRTTSRDSMKFLYRNLNPNLYRKLIICLLLSKVLFLSSPPLIVGENLSVHLIFPQIVVCCWENNMSFRKILLCYPGYFEVLTTADAMIFTLPIGYESYPFLRS